MHRLERVGIALGIVLLTMCIWMVNEPVKAQTISISPGVTLASCTSPAAGSLRQCNVSGDPLNPDGLYVSANGAAYFLLQPGGKQGPKGDTGPQGPQGLTGPQGPAGSLAGQSCHFTITSFTMDGKGNAGGILQIISCP